MPRPMSDTEWRAFVSEGTRTGALACVRRDGSPFVVPIWFVLDGDDIVFNTAADSLKGRRLRHEGRAAVSVDAASPPYAFVSLGGPVTLIDELAEVRRFATLIGARYMGAERGEEYGARNGVPGELVVRLRAERVFARAGVAD
jgi:PPOX class probable F420-dependent enzyme